MAKLTVVIDVVEHVPIPVPGTVDGLTSLVRFALSAETQEGAWNVAVALMSDDALRRLHLDFLGLDTATDIMTFPRGDDERGGDIAISVDRASDQAAGLGITAWEEVRFLTVHGVLHLCGWDDGDEEARARMLARQDDILTAYTAA